MPLRTERWGAALVKAEFLLTGRYIRKHKKQFFASIACIAVFAASIGAVQLFRLSSDNNTREERFSQEGRLGGYAQDADPSLITDGELEKWDAGAIYITGEAQTDFDTYENTTYVGFMDERAKNLQKLLFKAGDYPKTATEAAVVETTAKALKLGEIGETFTLNITEDGKTAKKKFILAGILREYPLDSWRVMPQVLTGEQGDRNTYLKTNIVYGIDLNKNRDANLFGSQDYNGPTATDEKPSPNEQIVNANMRVTSAVLTAFFLLLVLLGVYTVVKITFQDRERHIGLLRCIGMTKGQAVLSLVMQGIILALCAAVLCAPLGIGFAWVAALVMRLSGYPFFTLVIELQPVLISCAVCAGGRAPCVFIAGDYAFAPRRPFLQRAAKTEARAYGRAQANLLCASVGGQGQRRRAGQALRRAHSRLRRDFAVWYVYRAVFCSAIILLAGTKQPEIRL